MSIEKELFSEEELNSPEFKKADQRERLIFNVTEDLLQLMEDKGVNKAALAEALGKTKPTVSQLLSGSRNMTLSTLSDICFALGENPTVQVAKKKSVYMLPRRSTSTSRSLVSKAIK